MRFVAWILVAFAFAGARSAHAQEPDAEAYAQLAIERLAFAQESGVPRLRGAP